jgi:hypothetical protein
MSHHREDHVPSQRYVARRDGVSNFWTILDIFTGLPTSVDGFILTRMEQDEAYDMVELMNAWDRQRRALQSQQAG